MSVKVIRYANEGFKNYKSKVLINNELKEVEGCYAFVKKVFKGALAYNFSTNLKERIDDTKNVVFVNEETKVYARRFKASEISLRGDKGIFLKMKNDKIYALGESNPYDKKTIYTDFNLNWNFDTSFHLMTLKEVNNQITEYENLISNLKRLGYSIKKKDVSYVFYEMLIKEEDVRSEK